MKFSFFKNIILLGIIIFTSLAIQAEEYDFSFDIRKAKKNPAKKSVIQSSAASWRIGMHGLLLPDFLTASGEVVYGRFNENTNTGFSDWDRYLLKLGASGRQKSFAYGINFYSIGKTFDGRLNLEDKQKKGRTGYESWVSWDFKKLRMKSKYSKFWKDNDLQEQLYALETSYPLLSKPDIRFFLSYGIGEKGNKKTSTRDGSINLRLAKLSFVDEYLKLSSVVKQYSFQNKFDNQLGYQKNIVYLNSTLLPKQPLSITSSYQYTLNNQLTMDSEKKINKMESTVGLVYKLKETPARLIFSSGFNKYRSDDGETDRKIVKLTAKLDWKSLRLDRGLNSDWTVGLKYRQLRDFSAPPFSSSNWSVNLSCRLFLT